MARLAMRCHTWWGRGFDGVRSMRRAAALDPLADRAPRIDRAGRWLIRAVFPIRVAHGASV
jgi:hypothetical protein